MADGEGQSAQMEDKRAMVSVGRTPRKKGEPPAIGGRAPLLALRARGDASMAERQEHGSLHVACNDPFSSAESVGISGLRARALCGVCVQRPTFGGCGPKILAEIGTSGKPGFSGSNG